LLLHHYVNLFYFQQVQLEHLDKNVLLPVSISIDQKELIYKKKYSLFYLGNVLETIRTINSEAHKNNIRIRIR
jgi:hypothetical protein